MPPQQPTSVAACRPHHNCRLEEHPLYTLCSCFISLPTSFCPRFQLSKVTIKPQPFVLLSGYGSQSMNTNEHMIHDGNFAILVWILVRLKVIRKCCKILTITKRSLTSMSWNVCFQTANLCRCSNTANTWSCSSVCLQVSL